MLRKRIASTVTALTMALGLAGQFSTVASSTPSIVIPELSIAKKEIPDTDAMNFTKKMAIGWNLGNTFDATGTGFGDNMGLESSWCGIKTTKAMIDKVKEGGFETIRIPVSWHNHVVSKTDLTVSEAWMNRVQEVVDYAVDNDMYVILNIHHDNELNWLYPSDEKMEFSTEYVTAIWQQVAEKFKNYDEHLVFETLNEPRLVGDEFEWWIPDASYNAAGNARVVNAIKNICKLNQSAVDAIRAAGGKNANRYIMVPGYCAGPEGIMHEAFTMPSDTAVNKIIASVHAYRPYFFALAELTDPQSTPNFTLNSKDTKEIDDLMDSLYNHFIKNNVPVVIGEFGARNKEENTQARTNFATYYIAAAKARNIPCVWWDNNVTNPTAGEAFGILNRAKAEWAYPTVVMGLMKYAGTNSTVVLPPEFKTERIEGVLNDTGSWPKLTFPEAIGSKLELDIEAIGSVTGIMGGLCFNGIMLDGVSYWVGVHWFGYGKVVVDFSEITALKMGATYGANVSVEDEAVLAELLKLVQNEKTFEFQPWWGMNASGEFETPRDHVKLNGATLIKETLVEPSNPTGSSDVIYGDINGDGTVSIEDVVMLRLYLLKPDVYTISEKAQANAKVITGQNSIQGNCAVAIQDYVVQKIKTLPIALTQ